MKAGSTILVVDDNEDFRMLLRDVFEGTGYKVEEAENGEEALKHINDAGVSGAIVDLDMPKMNGLEFTKLVKEQKPNFPIVMVTAYAQWYSPIEILSLGVDAFLRKPVDLDKLAEIVGKL